MSTTGADTISVLAGGWSVRGLDLSRLPGIVIAVNDSAIQAPRVDVVCSMDRLWTENRWQEVNDLACTTHIRTSALKKIYERPDWLFPFECDWRTSSPSLEPGILNGTNSGACALNLALQMKPKRVVMFGFDMCVSPAGEPYWYPLPWWQGSKKKSDKSYVAWSDEFAPLASAFAAAGVEVLNASPASRIPNFPLVDAADVLA